MGCDFPIKAYRSATQKGPSGKPLLTFKPTDAMNSTSPLEVPCNNCLGCKLEHSRQWSIRMIHEARFHPANSFLTLTYDNENCPASYGLQLRDLQLFMKRLRKHLTVRFPYVRREHSAHIRRYGVHLTPKIRFYACGEYGDLNGRPHYHAIVFGYDAPDKVFLDTSGSGERIYRSETLQGLWKLGNTSTQDVTRKGCAYVARYVTKKIKSGDEFGADRYWRVSPIDGELHHVAPEFSVMSRRTGIGKKFADDFKSDFYPSGFLVVDGVRQSPPKFYVSQLTEEEQQRLKRQARKLSLKNKPHQTTERRLARAAVRDARVKRLQRML